MFSLKRIPWIVAGVLAMVFLATIVGAIIIMAAPSGSVYIY